MVSAKLGCEGSGSDGVTNEKLLGGGLEEDQKFTFWGMNITFGRQADVGDNSFSIYINQ